MVPYLKVSLNGRDDKWEMLMQGLDQRYARKYIGSSAS